MTSKLLGCLCWLAAIENEQGNNDGVVKYLADALILKPMDLKVTSAYARALYVERRYTEARSTILRLAPDVRRTPLNRATLGDVYRALGWYAHAVEAYGRLGDLSWLARCFCVVSWLRCGGPFNLQRSPEWAFERKVEQRWVTESANRHTTLSTFELPPEGEGYKITDELDNSLLKMLTIRLQLQEFKARSVRRPAIFGCLGLAWLIAFIVVYGVERHQVGIFSIVIAALVFAELAMLMVMPIDWIVRRSITLGRLRAKGQYLWWTVAIIAVMQLLSINVISLTGVIWLLVMDAAFSSAIWKSPLYNSLRNQARLREYDLRWLLLDGFLDLLYDVNKVGDRSLAYERTRWISVLEDMAFILENFFVPNLRSQDREIRTQIAKYGREAASSVRMMASTIAAPKDGTWERIVSDLRHNVLMIVSGNYGALRPRSSTAQNQISSGRGPVVIAILRVTMVVVVLGMLIGVLVASRNQKDIRTAIVGIIAPTVTALLLLLLGPMRREK